MSKALVVVVLLLVIVSALALGYFYYFVDTLMVSEVFGPTENPAMALMVDMLDFDTGLTRYDMYHLSQVSKEWKRRAEEIDKLGDVQARLSASNDLISEIMNDASVKKLTQKTISFGAALSKALVETLLGFDLSIHR